MRVRSTQLFPALALLSAVGVLAALAQTASAQTGFASGRTTGVDNPAMRYFGGGVSARQVQQASYQQPVTPTPLQPRGNVVQATATQRPHAKPFARYQPGPTLSPYLGMNYINTNSSLPNYYAYVRPLQQQQQAQQQAQYRQLRNLARTATASGTPAESYPGNVAPTGQGGQFMNSGGYFPRR